MVPPKIRPQKPQKSLANLLATKATHAKNGSKKLKFADPAHLQSTKVCIPGAMMPYKTWMESAHPSSYLGPKIQSQYPKWKIRNQKGETEKTKCSTVFRIPKSKIKRLTNID